MVLKLAVAQQKLLEYDKLGYIIYQLDESIFDARQKVETTWSPKRKNHLIPKTPFKLNKMQAVMGAISCYHSNFKFIVKGSYFNAEDTIHFLTKLRNFHRHKRLCIFWDNASIHVGKKVTAWLLTQRNMVSVENPEYSPEFNGIETLWAYAKKRFRLLLT